MGFGNFQYTYSSGNDNANPLLMTNFLHGILTMGTEDSTVVICLGEINYTKIVKENNHRIGQVKQLLDYIMKQINSPLEAIILIHRKQILVIELIPNFFSFLSMLIINLV